MSLLRRALARIPLSFAILASFTLGLMPFFPEPHLLEKLRMLVGGTLVRPIDIGDLLMHGAPWVALVLKLVIRDEAPGGQ